MMLIHISGLMIGLSKTNMQRTCHNFTTGFEYCLVLSSRRAK